MLDMAGDAWTCLDPPGDANWSHTSLWQTVGNRQNIGEPFWAERYYLRNTHPVQFNSNSNFFYQISQIEDHYCSMHIAQYFSVILMIRSLLSSKKLKDHLVGWQPTTVAESTGVELIEATFPLVNWAEGRDKTWKWIYHSKVNLSLKSLPVVFSDQLEYHLVALWLIWRRDRAEDISCLRTSILGRKGRDRFHLSFSNSIFLKKKDHFRYIN